ncbi:MAG TPA: hypothetical protein VHV32_19510 [Candidatus Angelobacter sp.]|jgi:hypothetical protein|nr:hypothetical protein [Candidatus Angelobacter sp.]
MIDVETLRERLKAALSKIDELEDTIADLEQQIADLEDDAERANDGPDYGDDESTDLDELPELLWLDMREFLSEIGFDPTNLPSSLGERVAIARIIEAARMFK